MNEVALTQEPEIYRPSAAINPERLEYLWKLAERMASSSMVPESLRTEGKSGDKKDLPRDQVVANVFAVCEQADRWNQSPFALLSCAAIVHGKLGFEGKVIAAVLEANYGITLHQYFTGNPTSDDYHIYLCDQPLPDDVVASLEPNIRIPGYQIMDGSVSGWKTTGNGSPWRPATYGKMLVFRGSREWCRVYKPAAIMGILADDELQEIEMDRRATSARNVTPSLANRFGGGNEGFNAANIKQIDNAASLPMDSIDAQTGEIIDAKRESSSDDRTAARQTNSSSQSTSSQSDGDKSSGGATSSSQRAPAGDFSEFSMALLRFGGTGNGREADIKKITAATDQFWSSKDGRPDHPADVALSKAIIGLHLRRMANEIDAETTKAESAKIIDSSFNGL